MRGATVGGVVMSVVLVGGGGVAVGRSAIDGRGDGCHRAARRYEVRCLMPRIEARFRFADDGATAPFVERMGAIEHACADVTAAALADCPSWPRVRPTPEYRQWLRDVRTTWEHRQVEIDGARPGCPVGARHCL
jgi:hypothetical protein